MNDFATETYFVDGGTLRANTPSYVKRPADDELFEALMSREFCYILTPRQMGKSSLMIRTSQRLRNEDIKTAIVDIQGIGTDKIREWYASLLSQIRRGLKLSVDIDEWMKKKSNIGYGQLFLDFIQDVVLDEINEQVVIFLDEVDWMIKIDFRDEFFASIRSIYNARANYDEFNRVSFVLLGVASPADLISEPTRTPFNIGHAIPLQELSLEDATPLQNGLEQVCPGEGERILRRVFYWTNGHPYLTQKICKTIAEAQKANWLDSEVDDLVDNLFLAEESRKEANLKFIQDRILNNSQVGQMLNIYKRVRRTRIKESGQSVTQNQLKLSGLLTSRDGYLDVRNRIYRTVFNDRWINRNTPKNWQRMALIVMSSLVVMLLAIVGYNYTVSLRLKTLQTDYIRGDPGEKMTALANIYKLQYLFSSNTDIDVTAAQAFYEFTSDSKTQLSLFPRYGVHDLAQQDDLITVISKLYVTLANVDEENDNTSLLRAMAETIHQSNMKNGIGDDLGRELDNWIIGRVNYKNGDYDSALVDYGSAISINPGNQATLYERAKVYIAKEDYENALRDLDAAIGAAKQSAPDIPPTPTPTNSPISPSETPALTTQPSNSTQSSEIPPTVDNTTPTIESTQNLSITSTSIPPTPIPTALPVQPVLATPDKFESNFTTLNHIIVAVKVLVDETPELRQALQPPATAYPNLNSVGLVKIYPTQTQKPTIDQTVLYQDDFTNPASGWPEDQFDNFFLGYHEPEYYHVEINSPDYKVTVLQPEKMNFTDATIETKALADSSRTDPSGDFQFGVVFRRSGDRYYAFTISPRAKKWYLLKSTSNALMVLEEGIDESIQDVNGEDALRVDAQGSNITLHINDKVVGQVPDSDYATGEVGFYVQTFEATQVHIHFDSLVVRSVGIPVLSSDTSQNFDRMVQIPSGTYEVGTTPADDYHFAPMSISLNGFWMDKYQVTYDQYQQYLVATSTQSPDVLGEGNHPVRGVTWDQAVAYCSWTNKRLPTEAEWEAAGRGPGPSPQLYPWGNDPSADGNAFSLPGRDTYEVGTLPFNESDFGVYDMVGNIWEWVGEPYSSIPDGIKVLRGGRFGLPILDLAYRLSVAPDDAGYVPYAGFRCAANTPSEDNSTQGSNGTQRSTIQHSVNDGEWLAQIARCYGADLNAVQSANPQISDPKADLLPGQIVTVPNIGSNGTIYGPPCITYYTVQSGDTWNLIAQKFNADVLELQERNSGVTLVSGVKLLIPLNSTKLVFTPTETILGIGFINKASASFWTGPNSGLIRRLGFSQPITILEQRVVSGSVWYRCKIEINGVINEGWILGEYITFGPAPTTSTNDSQISCTNQSVFIINLPNDDRVHISCPVSGRARIIRLDNTVLPLDLPAGYTYISGINIDIIQNDEPIQVITEGGYIQISFVAVSLKSGVTYSILYWDAVNSTWVPLKDFLLDENGNPHSFILFPNNFDDIRQIVSGVRLNTSNSSVEVSTNFPGIFVLTGH